MAQEGNQTEKIVFLENDHDSFLTLLEKRLLEQDIKINDFVIDNICFRCRNTADFEAYFIYRKEQSILHTQSFFHERNFYIFLLKQPITYGKQEIMYVKVSELGGSLAHETGFQHIEVIVPQNYDFKPSITYNRYNKKEVKRDDGLSVKFTHTSMFPKSTVKDGGRVILYETR